MKYLIYLTFVIGLILAVIWIIQQVSTIKLLENPMAGAGIFLLTAFLLNVLTRRKADK
jgi:hypothetical protein